MQLKSLFAHAPPPIANMSGVGNLKKLHNGYHAGDPMLPFYDNGG